MSEQLNIQFGVDATRALRAAEQAGALAGKLFGKKFQEAADAEVDNIEAQIEIDIEGLQKLEQAEQDAKGLVKILNMSGDAARKKAKALDDVALASRKAANSAKKLAEANSPARWKKQTNAMEKSVRTLKKMREGFKKGTDRANRLDDAIKKMTGRLNKMKGTNVVVEGLQKAFGGLTTKFLAANVGADYLKQGMEMLWGATVKFFDDMDERQRQIEGLSLSLRTAGISAGDVGKVMNSVKATALTFGTSMETVAGAWKRLGPTMLATGYNIKEVEDTIVALGARSVSLGLNADQAGRQMEALAQVFGKGKLQSEELVKQFGQVDGSLRSQLDAYAKANQGVTSLEDAMKTGSYSAAQFQEALVAVSEDAVQKLKGEMWSLSSVFQNAGTKGNITLTQFEAKLKTIDTITLDNLGASFDSSSRAIWRMKGTWSKAFLAMTTDNKSFMKSLKLMSDGISSLLEILNGALVLTMLLGGKIADAQMSMVFMPMDMAQKFMNWFSGLHPVLKDGADAFTRTGEAIWQFAGKMYDALTQGPQDIGFLEKINKEIKETGTISKDSAKQLEEAFKAISQSLSDGLARIKELDDEKKRGHEDTIKRLNDQKQKEKDLHDQAKRDIKDRYDTQKRELDEVRRKLQENFDLERGRINEMTYAEKELQRIRVAELKAKTQNQSLSRKERLEAQAELDQMNRRVRLEKLRKKEKEEMAKLDEKEKQMDQKKETNLKKQNQLYKDKITAIDEALKVEEAAIDEIDTAYRQLKATIESARDLDNKYIELNRQDALAAIADEITAIKQLKQAYKDARSGGGGGSSAAPNAWTGGPVTGGELRTVNEFGKEAFLSASGKLSMINAPAWGEWRAPSHGTIIPAHLTKQLDIPRGGVNLNSAPKATAVSVNGMGGIASAIRGMGGGDSIMNNVTVQSANPNKTASDMLVSLTKIRRRRLR